MRRSLILLFVLAVSSPLFAAPMVSRLIVSGTNGIDWNGPCPREFVFAADITVRRGGTLLVQWVRSDGATGNAVTLRFARNETRRIFDRWVVGRRYQGWEQLRVTDPQGYVSLSRRVTFRNRCR